MVTIEVTLQIDKKVKDYFTRRELLPHQNIIENKEQNDDLIVTTIVSYEEEILKVVRYWMPHIRILKPVYLYDKLTKQLEDYI